jgi:hypothetical protein
MSKKTTTPQPTAIPARAPNGIKVYYSSEDEHYIREQARKNGMTVQQYLKWKIARERERRIKAST